MTITQNIFSIMDKKNISQITLAQYTGISTSAISAWRHKNAFPSSEKLPLIAECLGVSISELFGIADNSTKEDEGRIYSELFNSELISKTYLRLSEKEKLQVQVYILDLAEKSEHSSAEVRVVEG